MPVTTKQKATSTSAQAVNRAVAAALLPFLLCSPAQERKPAQASVTRNGPAKAALSSTGAEREIAK